MPRKKRRTHASVLRTLCRRQWRADGRLAVDCRFVLRRNKEKLTRALLSCSCSCLASSSSYQQKAHLLLRRLPVLIRRTVPKWANERGRIVKEFPLCLSTLHSFDSQCLPAVNSVFASPKTPPDNARRYALDAHRTSRAASSLRVKIRAAPFHSRLFTTVPSFSLANDADGAVLRWGSRTTEERERKETKERKGERQKGLGS